MEYVYGIYRGEQRNMGNPEEKQILGNPGKDGRIILKYVLEKYHGMACNNNGVSCSIKQDKFLDYLRNC
jgi:hypothetical protein